MLSTLPLTFVTIVERGSITLAADELDLAKSAVSQNLKRLEEGLGVKLATRTTRSFTLTPAGRRYYDRCKEIVVLAKKAETEMEDFGLTPAGEITITAPHAFIAPVIAPAMQQIIAQFPKLKPSIIAEDKCLNLVSEGIDLSITVGSLPDSSLKARRIGTLTDILCASPALLNQPPRVKPTDTRVWVQSLPYIAHTREANQVRHQMSHNQSKEHYTINFEPCFFSNTVEAQTTFARSGLGVALLPKVAISHDLKEGRLIEVLPEYSLKSKPIYAVHAYGNHPPKSVLLVIEMIERELKLH